MPLWLGRVFGAGSLQAPAWLLLQLLSTLCPLSPGQEYLAAALPPPLPYPPLQGSSYENWRSFPSCCQPQVLKQNAPCPHHQLPTEKPDALPSARDYGAFNRRVHLGCQYSVTYLRVRLPTPERKKEVHSAANLLATRSKELFTFFFSALSFLSSKDFSEQIVPPFVRRLTWGKNC